MASKIYFIFTIAVMGLLSLSVIASAVEHVVGDDKGWIPSFDYAAWASGKHFRVGDTLVFKYQIGKHNVIRVSGAPDFNYCRIPSGNGTSPLTSGNDVITLSAPGNKWYLCGAANGQHCESGQKLAITVEPKVEAPAPSAVAPSWRYPSKTPWTPSKVEAPAPSAIAPSPGYLSKKPWTPSVVTRAVEHVVGDESGWTTGFNYAAWTAGKHFRVGDTLVFNYLMGKHNVFRVNATDFYQCRIPSGVEASPLTSGNDIITLSTPGKKWYLCGAANGQHCESGQKLSITVETGFDAPTPSAAPPKMHLTPARKDLAPPPSSHY